MLKSKIVRISTLVLSFIVIVGTLLPLFRASLWWVRVFDYPQIQIAVLSLITSILVYLIWGLKKKWSFILFLILATSFIYKLTLIGKYTPVVEVTAENSENSNQNGCFKVLQTNVKMDNREAEKVINIIKVNQPDILILNEPDQWWHDQLTDVKNSYPHRMELPLNNTYGMMLFSKFQLSNKEINFLVKEDIPSFFATVTLPNDNQFNLHCLHPEPPQPGKDTYERDTELLLVAKRIRKTSSPAMVVGDLNDVAWSYTSELFQKYSNLLDPREGRGFFNTYNANIPLFRYPLDHFFYSRDFGLVELKKLDDVGSDHFPMLMEVCLEEEKDHSKNHDPADQKEKKKVDEKIEQGFKQPE